MNSIDDTSPGDRGNADQADGTRAAELLRRHPELVASWLFLTLVDLEQQAVAMVRFAGHRRGVQLAPTLVGLAGGAAAIAAHQLLNRLTATGSSPYRTSLAVATAALLAAPVAGLGRRGVVLPRRNPLWGLAVPVLTQLGWMIAVIVLGRRQQAEIGRL